MVNAFTSFCFPGISGERSWQSTCKISYFEAKKVPKVHKFESRILIFSKKIRFWIMKYINMRDRKMTSFWKYIFPNIIHSGQLMLETNLDFPCHNLLLKSLKPLKLVVKYIPYTWIKFDNNFFEDMNIRIIVKNERLYNGIRFASFWWSLILYLWIGGGVPRNSEISNNSSNSLCRNITKFGLGILYTWIVEGMMLIFLKKKRCNIFSHNPWNFVGVYYPSNSEILQFRH